MEIFNNKLDVYKAVEKHTTDQEIWFKFDYNGWRYAYSYETEEYYLRILWIWIEISF